jgi:hypothetical protein
MTVLNYEELLEKSKMPSLKVRRLRNNSYMIYIFRNPILWLGISAYGGGGVNNVTG